MCIDTCAAIYTSHFTKSEAWYATFTRNERSHAHVPRSLCSRTCAYNAPRHKSPSLASYSMVVKAYQSWHVSYGILVMAYLCIDACAAIYTSHFTKSHAWYATSTRNKRAHADDHALHVLAHVHMHVRRFVCECSTTQITLPC